jgi:ribosome-binding protein aMBF1 (putative translation factor)
MFSDCEACGVMCDQTWEVEDIDEGVLYVCEDCADGYGVFDYEVV